MGKRKPSVATSSLGMVSTASSVATDAGVRMLKAGGNAVDAAVAAALCLGVSEPQASGLGGQTMALLYLDDGQRAIAVDGSSRAPFGVDPTKIPKKPITVGLAASTVPSTPATLGYLLETYGKLSLDQVLEPAIEAAKDGVRVTHLMHDLIKRESDHLSRDSLASRRFFRDGRPLAAGSLLIQPELARCLETLARQGWRDFYHGGIASGIISDMEKRGGLLCLVDLAQVPVPLERPVLQGRYRRLHLATFPPPGAGRALVEILNILETFEPEEIRLDSPDANVILAHVFMNALRDRDKRPVDPDIYTQSRRKRMVDKRYAERIAERIRKVTGILPPDPTAPPVAGETTHLSVADADGNVVGITQSIEFVFGSKRANPAFGFFYNNYMATFHYKDMTHPYYLLPGASPWSSVAPTLLFRKRKPWLTLGSPGSERIASALAQVITRVVDAGMPLDEAIGAPRLHASQAGTILIEKKRFHPAILDALERVGFELTKRGAYSFYLGCVQAIQLPLTRREMFVGVADPRRDGSAKGPET
ncbi:MAG: gamma-glutamyltransferase [Latescibacteria bacterium DG_63]|nr:MAG: gamma-glutamyltransferase [Latescibacteria bacterium DG_63]